MRRRLTRAWDGAKSWLQRQRPAYVAPAKRALTADEAVARFFQGLKTLAPHVEILEFTWSGDVVDATGAGPWCARLCLAPVRIDRKAVADFADAADRTTSTPRMLMTRGGNFAGEAIEEADQRRFGLFENGLHRRCPPVERHRQPHSRCQPTTLERSGLAESPWYPAIARCDRSRASRRPTDSVCGAFRALLSGSTPTARA